MARAPKMHHVTIANIVRTIDCAANQTVLGAAIRAGIDYPYACASGNPAQCISKLESGIVSRLPHGDAALSAAQTKAGQTRACRARPRGDMSITWLGRGRK